MAIPGTTTTHQAEVMYWRPEASIRPHEESGGWMPKFYAVLGGRPAADAERPVALPPALAKALQPHTVRIKLANWPADQPASWQINH